MLRICNSILQRTIFQNWTVILYANVIYIAQVFLSILETDPTVSIVNDAVNDNLTMFYDGNYCRLNKSIDEHVNDACTCE